MKFVKLTLEGFELRLVPSSALSPPAHCGNPHAVGIVGVLKFDADTNALILVVTPPFGPARRYKLEWASKSAEHHASHLVNHNVIIHGQLLGDNETITHARARRHK